jgi:hypothetical protein
VSVGPLSVGEIVNRAITLTLRNWQPSLALASAVAVVSVFEGALFAGAPFSTRAWLGNGALEAADDLVGGAMLLALAALLAGRATTLGAALQQVRTGGWRYARFVALYGAVSVVLWVFFEVARGWQVGRFSFVAFIAGNVALAFGTLALSLTGAVVVLEGRGVRDAMATALRRSSRRDQALRIAFLAFGLGCAYVGVLFTIGTIGSIAGLVLPGQIGPTLGNFLDVVVNWLLVSAVGIVLACDQRLRAEGSDLEAELDASRS